VRTRAPATADEVVAHRPDAVVVATGASHAPRSVEGWGTARTASQALAEDRWDGELVLILDADNGWTAASVAETVASRGGSVHLVTTSGTPLWGVTEYSRMTYLERLRGLGVQLWPSAHARLADGAVTIRSAMHDRATTIVGITRVVALDPPLPRDALVGPLLDTEVEVHTVGDVVAPRTLLDAMAEGHTLGRAL
jgi:dimethylglycine catabolism A